MEFIVVVGYLEIFCSLVSFLSSFRIFLVIVLGSDLRKMRSYQIMAYIAFMECWQMSATLLGGIMVSQQSKLNDTLYAVVGNIAFSAWMTLLVLRCCLALNRFTVLTSFSRVSFLEHRRFHSVLMLFPTTVLLSIIILCIIYGHPFVMIIELGGWNFIGIDPCRPIESFFSNGMTSCAFGLYLTTFIYIIKMKHQTHMHVDLGEFRILISSAVAFSYEMCMIILFHCIFPFIEVPPWTVGVIGILWSFLPGFNGIMLLTINRNFRSRFFSLKWSTVSTTHVLFNRVPNIFSATSSLQH
ncbi:hypothetical protein QR680_015686 [Steinernema hermaphroditum]|uniref:7TM GPCR serpentine receptor class x (Srx) domain-containing protein n=1 Tax=Steinernema hermaphroditum TaxID=289476 RepID=A0AA39LKN9_9BILA|nr:hypothetical protein QR680_015686 [Steinernema hermaphroditum]